MLRPCSRIASFASLFAVVGLGGCGDPEIALPEMSPRSASSAALTEYDKNSDDSLDAKELDLSPGLKASLPRADKDSNGALNEAEIKDRLARYGEDAIALMPFSLVVRIDGRPLADALVTLDPEKFLGASYKPVVGKTDQAGTVKFRLEGNNFDGVYAGLYRVQVSWKNQQGNEMIPSRYNSQTTLGQEVALDVEGIDHAPVLELSSKPNAR